jgi:hypothetical protein
MVITLSWRLRPLGHLTGLNLDDSMRKGRNVENKRFWRAGCCGGGKTDVVVLAGLMMSCLLLVQLMGVDRAAIDPKETPVRDILRALPLWKVAFCSLETERCMCPRRAFPRPVIVRANVPSRRSLDRFEE